MRNQFLGHFKETDVTVTKLWKTATFVFDANVLLNLYRYSDETRDDFMGLLENLKSRSWLPEQAAHEFLKNRANVIKDQISSYKTTLNDIDKLRKSFSGSRAHPFISKDSKKSLTWPLRRSTPKWTPTRKNRKNSYTKMASEIRLPIYLMVALVSVIRVKN